MKMNPDPRRRDVLAAAAARAHADAEPDDQEAAARHGVSRRSGTRWRHEGPPAVRGFQTYLRLSPNPWRLVAETRTTAKHETIRKLSHAGLVERIRELRAAEKSIEGVDNGHDVTPGLPWLDRAAQKERDAAVNEELAACFRECACRRLTEEEVFG